MVSGTPAGAQQASLPVDVSVAIERAIAAGRQAATNAAASAQVANVSARDEIAQRTGAHVLETALSAAVVGGIARHPQATTTIVRAAVTRAPAYRDAIVKRAKIAFPMFAQTIDAGAGLVPAPPPTPRALSAPSPSPSLAPVSSPAPISSPTPSLLAPQPRTMAQIAPAPSPTPPPPTMMPAAAQEVAWWHPSELRIGTLFHDAGVFGSHKENGADVTIDMRLQPLNLRPPTGSFWDAIFRPRPLIGFNINTTGNTSTLYFGMTFDWTVWDGVFVTLDVGGAVHNGKLSTRALNRKELGSRILFREGLELGYRFLEHHAISFRFDHMSNARLASHNEGLDTLGIIYAYRF